MLFGAFKKLVIADTVAIAVRSTVERGATAEGYQVFLLILFYTAQVYCDFSGGTDIALGLSQMFGIELPENFNSPFSSTSVKEYWRRWHITLGRWLSEYIFYPLSLCRPMQRLSLYCRARFGARVGGRIPVYLASLTTWLASGLWHGFGANYIVWGLSNCAVILISQELSPVYKKVGDRVPVSRGRLWQSTKRVGTLLVVGSIRLLDCYGSVSLTVTCLWRMLSGIVELGGVLDGALGLGLSLPEYCVILFGLAAVYLASKYRQRCGEPLSRRVSRSDAATYLSCTLLLLLTLIFGAYGLGYDASGFIYNQF